MSLQCSRLAVCLLNVSEARNQSIIERIAEAACNVTIPRENVENQFKCSSTVLNVFSDFDYNRSVLTIAAPIHNLVGCVTSACKIAYQTIDLREHHGGHPRLGAVDLVPIYPISSLLSLEQCGKIAVNIGKQITSDTPGTSVFFFGTADYPKQRGLVERRKEVGWYKGRHGMCYGDVKFDVGAVPTSEYGCTGVGASLYVMNCNITIETDDLVVGREIAKTIRGSSQGGLPGVQAMAFKHEGCIEIACNVESYKRDVHQNQTDTEQTNQSNSAPQYISPTKIRERITSLTSKYKIGVKETTVVGFTPSEVYKMAYKALSEGNAMVWKTSNQHYRM